MKKSQIPLYLISASAGVSIWSNWVELGKLASFGPVHLLPGLVDDFEVNTAITLPLGVEAYAFYAMSQWLTEKPVPAKARNFAKWSSLIAGGLGVAGSVAAHVLIAQGAEKAPLPITIFVSTLPVIVFLLTGLLSHLLRSASDEQPVAHSGEQVSKIVNGEQPEVFTAPESAHSDEQVSKIVNTDEQSAAHEVLTAHPDEQADEQVSKIVNTPDEQGEQVPPVDEQVEQLFAEQAADLREHPVVIAAHGHEDRDRAAHDLLKANPDMSARELAEQLTAQGFEVSRPTAQRIRSRLAA